MPNKNYIKGRNKEYRIMAYLREHGFDFVTRSAGSHSPIDVIGFNSKTSEIRLIQCKPKSMSENKKNQILKEIEFLDGFYQVSTAVI